MIRPLQLTRDEIQGNKRQQVKCWGRDRSQLTGLQRNSGICHLVLQQINDNYPADTSTVITLQVQEQGEMK